MDVGTLERLPHVVRLRGGVGLVRCVRDEGGAWVRVLQVGGAWQSATYLGERRMEPVFEYYRAFDRVFAIRPAAGRVLMLGGGGYAWPKHVAATRPGVRVDVVELDPTVMRVARRWFYLDEAMTAHPGAIGLLEGDGRAWLERQAAEGGARYDAIVNDTFCGTGPVPSLATLEAMRATKGCLVPGGLYLANVVSEDGGADLSFLRDVLATLAEAFACVRVVPCFDERFAREDNYLVMASDSAFALEGELPLEPGVLGDVLRD